MQFSWKSAEEFKDIRFELGQGDAQGILKITINRPEVRNAFRPQTVNELQKAFTLAREMTDIGVVVICGEGEFAFCAGGDQKVRGDAGYIGDDGVPRLNILEVQRQIRTLPKPVIAMVAGYAVGGGQLKTPSSVYYYSRATCPLGRIQQSSSRVPADQSGPTLVVMPNCARERHLPPMHGVDY